MASAAVVPGAPTWAKPIFSSTSPTESPWAGVGASDRSMMPNGTPKRRLASCATSWPTRVILNAVRLMVSHKNSKSRPTASSSARLTTPGPETPTLITASPSVTPWKPPAINGLSSGALQNATNFTQPYESLSAVAWAISLIMWPNSSTAFMSMPVFVEPTFTLEHTMSVSARACGRERMSSSSAGVMALFTSAE